MYNTSNHLKSLFFPLALFETGGYMYAVAIFVLVDGGEGGGGVLTEGMPFKTVSQARVATYT